MPKQPQLAVFHNRQVLRRQNPHVAFARNRIPCTRERGEAFQQIFGCLSDGMRRSESARLPATLHALRVRADRSPNAGPA